MSPENQFDFECLSRNSVPVKAAACGGACTSSTECENAGDCHLCLTGTC